MRWRQYVPVHQRKAKGRKIAKTFWGSSWCSHLENFSDFSNRLPRGRTYARNGSIVHLEISTGKITAMVAGSSLYHINIKIDKMSKKAWQRLCDQCSSSVTSTIDLLRGKLPTPILNTLTASNNDLFPRSSEIHLDCNCPDWAHLCKHLAAVLYGVGSRLDDSPELLFVLRGVDPNDLIGSALVEATDSTATLAGSHQLDDDSGLEDIFGIDLIDSPPSGETATSRPKRKRNSKAKASATKKTKRTPKAKSVKKKAAKKKSKASEASSGNVKKKTVKKTVKKKPSNKGVKKKASKPVSKAVPQKKTAKKASKKTAARKKSTKKKKAAKLKPRDRKS